MCKGTSRSGNSGNNNTITPTSKLPNTITHHDTNSSFSTTDDNDNDVVSSQIIPPTCELCGKNASLYCLADDAYLCRKCDQWVHGANFLANRHVRCLLCDGCCRFTTKFIVGHSKEVRVSKVELEKKKQKRGRSTHFCETDGGEEDGGGYYCCGTGNDHESSLRAVKTPFVFL